MSDSSLLEEAFSRLLVLDIRNGTLPSANDSYDVSVVKDLRSVSDHCVIVPRTEDEVFSQDGNNNIQSSFSETGTIGIKRRSSSAKSPPEYKRRKSVTFADSKGQDLVEVREYDSTIEPLQNGLSENQRKYTRDEVTLPKYILLFPQPCANYSAFVRKLYTQSVCLENAQIISSDVLIGTIKVRNVAYEKNVGLRMTMDSWKTFSDVEAKYLHSDNPDVDVFSFRIKIAADVLSVKFCIRFICDGKEYWDNNDGNNYCVTAREHPDNRALADMET